MSVISLPLLTRWSSSPSDNEQCLILSDVTWSQYQQFLDSLENSSHYRTTYLAGILEIMSPSRLHEIRKKSIARLLEVYLQERGIDFWGYGSTTLQAEGIGKEPDECYCLGTQKDLPDLAIEVIITSGSSKILETYGRLGVAEVWLWQDDSLRVYCWQDNQYILRDKSQLLPQLDLELFSQLVVYANPRLAVEEFKKILSGR